MTVHALIEEARADGLELRSIGDRLKLRGPADLVARWKPRIAADKAGILAALADNDAPIAHDLARLIARAGAYWEYSPDDYATIFAAARRDPEGLRLALENDVAFRLPASTADLAVAMTSGVMAPDTLPGLDGDDTRRSCSRKSKSAILHFCLPPPHPKNVLAASVEWLS